MENCLFELYPLPTIHFVGGETQEIAFDAYFHADNHPFGLDGCEAEFAIVSYTNKTGEPIFRKSMEVTSIQPGGIKNVLYLKLLPEDTFQLNGKYIYQISLRDVDGDVEIPRQGIIYAQNNIDRVFIGAQSSPFAYHR